MRETLLKTGNLETQIGKTTLVLLKSLSEQCGNEIWAKLEYLNPGGSIKDRTALFIVNEAEKMGLIKPGDILVEGTAGNTGIGIAQVAIPRGYKVIVTMPNNQSEEKYKVLRFLGAEVRTFPPCPFANQDHFYHQARRIVETMPHAFWCDQFENPANFKAHYSTTGPEIWDQTLGQVDFFVNSSGTGGTIAGVSNYLKEKQPQIQVVLVDPEGSGLFEYYKNGVMKAQGNSVSEGVGIMRITANMSKAKIDEVLRVTDEQMWNMMRYIAQHEGYFIGFSAGLNLHGALEIGLRHKNQGKKIVTLICDHGSRYLSKMTT